MQILCLYIMEITRLDTFLWFVDNENEPLRGEFHGLHVMEMNHCVQFQGLYIMEITRLDTFSMVCIY